MLHTTFRKLRAEGACGDGYKILRKNLSGKGFKDSTPIPLTVVLDSNGIDDTLWCLRATLEMSEGLARSFAVECALRVLPLFEVRFPGDMRPRCAVETAQRYLSGTATEEELERARVAASTAARVAAWADEREWQVKRLEEMLIVAGPVAEEMSAAVAMVAEASAKGVA